MKFALLFIASLALAKCNSGFVLQPRHELTTDWYETAIFYQIYPRSFKDSDGDGIGDIQGIISKLQHLKDSGVTATWLSPIFKSPMKDFGYDISDFREVDEIFGTNEDLEELFRKADELDIKIILDFVPNHTSDQHEWFLKSANRTEGFEDYYIWMDCVADEDGTVIQPPNNWNSVFYGYAWTYHPEREQCYFHQFLSEQPDLNYRNEAVVREMKDVLTFWLEKGASGFRVDAINHLIEDESFRNETVDPYVEDRFEYGYTYKEYSKDQPETYQMVYDFRDHMDAVMETLKEDSSIKQHTRILMTEAYANLELTMKYYGEGGRVGSHMPFNFRLINDVWPSDTSSSKNARAYDFKRVIDELLAALPENKKTNWVIGNHDQPRVGSRFGYEKIEPLLALVMTLPGIAVTYNGEEIGMVDYRDISYEDTRDPQGCNVGIDKYKERSRDPERTPFQWDSTNYAGFTSGQGTWLPIHPNYYYLNLDAQQKADRSTYKFYQQLSQLRQQHTLMEGGYVSRVFDDDVFVMRRFLDDHTTYFTIINFAHVEKTVNIVDFISTDTDERRILRVVAAGSKSCRSIDDIVSGSSLYLKPYDTIIVVNGALKVGMSLMLTIFAFIFARFFN